MKMKKIVPLAMTALLLGAASVSANEGEVVLTNTTQQEQVQPSFIKVTGIVEEIEVRDNATYYTTKDGENINVFVVTKDTLVFDNTGKDVQLQKGDRVTAYTYANKPMILIYPPQYSPEVVILETKEMGAVEVDYFDKDLVNKSNTLKLNISGETILQSVSGKQVTAKDLAEQYLLAFYTTTTRSIPAQTTPTKIIVIDTIEKTPGEVDPIEAAVQKIIATDSYEVKGTTMVPLRLIAEKLGYQVKSTGKGAIISKGPVSFNITRGEKTYGYNKALRQFNVAPALLEPNKTYVPVEFVEDLLNK